MSRTETSFLTQRRRNPRFMLLSVLLTAVVIGAFFYESHVGFGKRPQHLIYVASWPANRTAADAVREQNVRETARQAAIAQFEIERGQALLSRAQTPQSKVAAQAHIAQNRAALAKWKAEHAVAQAVLEANPAASNTQPIGLPPPDGGLGQPAN
jgi:hypothetical protein